MKYLRKFITWILASLKVFKDKASFLVEKMIAMSLLAEYIARLRVMRNDNRGSMLGFVFGMFILILIGASLITTVAYQSTQAQANTSVTGATDSIIGLWPLLFAIIPVIVLVRIFR